MGCFSSKYSSQPQTLRMYLPWYSWTHIFSCSGDSSMLRVFLRMASAITLAIRQTLQLTPLKPGANLNFSCWIKQFTRCGSWLLFFYMHFHTCSGTQSWLIFNVYFCLSLFGETMTQITTIIWPTREINDYSSFISLLLIILTHSPANSNPPLYVLRVG